MKIVELARLGYAFRSRGSGAGACVTLCGPDNRVIRVCFSSSVYLAMNEARKLAIADHVARRLS